MVKTKSKKHSKESLDQLRKADREKLLRMNGKELGRETKQTVSRIGNLIRQFLDR